MPRARSAAAPLALIAAAAAPARAQQPPAPTREDALFALVALGPGAPGVWRWALSGQALATSDNVTAAGGLGVAGELSYAIDECRVFATGGFATASLSFGGTDVAANHWLSACLTSGNLWPTVEVGHKLDLSVTPALSAPRRAFAVPYSAETVHMAFVPLELRRKNGDRWGFWRMTPAFTWMTTDDGGLARLGGLAHLEFGIDFEMARWTRPRDGGDLGLDVFHVDFRIVSEGYDVGTVQILPVRLSGVRLGGLLLDAALGWAHVGVQTDPAVPGGDPVVLHAADTVVGRLAARRAFGTLTAGLDLDRGAWPAAGDEAVVETRGTLWATQPVGDVTFSAKGFAAWTDVWPGAGEARGDLTAGGEAVATWAVDRSVRISLRGEAASSFYAQEDGSLAPSFAVRGWLVVSAQLGSR